MLEPPEGWVVERMRADSAKRGWLCRSEGSDEWYPIAAVMGGGSASGTVRLWIDKGDSAEAVMVTRTIKLLLAAPKAERDAPTSSQLRSGPRRV